MNVTGGNNRTLDHSIGYTSENVATIVVEIFPKNITAACCYTNIRILS